MDRRDASNLLVPVKANDAQREKQNACGFKGRIENVMVDQNGTSSLVLMSPNVIPMLAL